MSLRDTLIADAKAWLDEYRGNIMASLGKPMNVDWVGQRLGYIFDALADAREMVAAGDRHAKQLEELHEIAQKVMATQLASIVNLGAELAAAKTDERARAYALVEKELRESKCDVSMLYGEGTWRMDPIAANGGYGYQVAADTLLGAVEKIKTGGY